MPTPSLFSDFTGSYAAKRPVDAITDGHRGPSPGDAGTALRRAIDDALFDLLEARERARESHRLFSPAAHPRGGVQAL